jgi:hypothetical protein
MQGISDSVCAKPQIRKGYLERKSKALSKCQHILYAAVDPAKINILLSHSFIPEVTKIQNYLLISAITKM